MFLINSPVVRAENLRFREDGVREIITKVLLPWLNSFRFFLGQTSLFKKETGKQFFYHPQVGRSSNTMDRWILARCQSLIRFVREEMAAYRLYTVIPRLLELIDELTNWYIRFNRSRLKGQDSLSDTKEALNTLFETLFTLCRTMVCKCRLCYICTHTSRQSSFTPFLTENIYQSLRSFILSKDLSLKDDRSIHFLPFPEVKEELYDAEIERQVQRMKIVIELTRAMREKSSISLKVSCD